VQQSNLRFIFFLLFSAFVVPVNAQYDFTVSETEGCVPLKVKFTFTTTVADDTAYIWDFGNGQISTLRNPDTVVYEVPGLYSPTLLVNSRGDLVVTKPNLIEAHRVVPATFDYKDTISYAVFVLEPSATLDTGVNYTFSWEIEGFAPRTGQRQVVTFPDTGTYTIRLTLSDEYGCTSSASRDITVFQEITVQNVFSPNGDRYLQFFRVSSNGGVPIVVKIFSRTGILVYEGEGTDVTWDGTTASGIKLKPGIYFYAIEAISGDPDKRNSKAGLLYMYE
jgi:gliding motility-associated-like protein